MRGRTSQIQYGIPLVASVPVEPKRKCSSSEANCGGASGLASRRCTTRPAAPARKIRPSSTLTVRYVKNVLCVVCVLCGGAAGICRPSERLHVFHDGRLLRVGQPGAEEVAAVAVARA